MKNVFKHNRRRTTSIVKHPLFKSGLGPSDIEGLYLWFPDFNLDDEGSGSFSWLDEVSKTILIEGSYGAGEGIVSLNGKNWLDTFGGTSTINSNILDVSEFTFGGIIQSEMEEDLENGSVHSIIRDVNNRIGFYFTESYLAYFVQNNNFLRYSIEVSDFSYTKNTPVIYFVTFKFNISTTLNLYFKGNHHTDSGPVVLQQNHGYNLNNFDTPFHGKIGEFFYFDRVLSEKEIDYLGNYLSRKYGVFWSNITV